MDDTSTRTNFKSHVQSWMIILILIVNGFEVDGQSYHLPYLIGNTYGIADENGKLIQAGPYQEIITAKDAALSLGKTNETWDVIGKNGGILIPQALRGEYKRASAGTAGIHIAPAFRKVTTEDGENYIDATLFRISESERGKFYLINPNVPLKDYVSFMASGKGVSNSSLYSPPNPVNTGIVKVMMPDGKTNFVDRSGNILLAESVIAGDVYGENILAVVDDTGQYRLYNQLQHLISEKYYEEISSLQNGKFVLGKRRVYRFEQTLSLYDLFDGKGTLLFQDRNFITYATPSMVFENDSANAYIYDLKGKLIKTFPGAQLRYNYVNPEMPFIVKDGKTGLINSEGVMLVEPAYTSLSPWNDHNIFFQQDNSGGVLDKLFRIRWERDSILVSEEIRELPGYYAVMQLRNDKYRYGVVDSTGKIIIPAIYEKCYFIKGWNFFRVERDSLSGVINLKGEQIFPTVISDFEFDFSTREIKALTADSVKVYNDAFQVVHSWDRVKEELRSYKGKEAYGLKDVHENVITPAVYTSIKRIQELVTRKWGYLARRFYVEGDSADLLNPYGQNIVPDGYVFYFPNVVNGAGDVMNCIVTNQQDIREGLSIQRTGLIDVMGRWVIPPDYQKIHIMGDEIIVSTNVKSLERTFYNHTGEIISKKPYQYFNSRSEEGLYYNRIRVGYAATDSLQRANLALQLMSYSDRMGAIRKGTHEESPYLFGAIDVQGSEIISCKYLEMDDFLFTYTCVKGQDKNGEIYYALIDLDGKVLMKTAYELDQVHPADSTLLQIRQNGKQGLLRVAGELFVEPKYNEIKVYKDFQVVLAEDSISTYLIPYATPDKIVSLGHKGNTDIEQITKEVFVLSISESGAGIDTKRFSFFNSVSGLLSQVVAHAVKESNAGWYVPEDFVVVQDTADLKPYLMNYVTGEKYKRE